MSSETKSGGVRSEVGACPVSLFPFACSFSLVLLPPLRARGCIISPCCRAHERALLFWRLCRSRPVSLSRRLYRVPSAVSFLAVFILTNARFPVCVVVALDPSLCRATSNACPRLPLVSPLLDVPTRVSVLASLLRFRRFSVTLPLMQGEIYIQ